MKEIEKKMVSAFNASKDFKSANTEVCNLKLVVAVKLFGNTIAIKNKLTNHVKFSLAGWNTPTTRSRLNALGCNVSCTNSTPYLNGVKWFGDFCYNDIYTLFTKIW